MGNMNVYKPVQIIHNGTGKTVKQYAYRISWALNN